MNELLIAQIGKEAPLRREAPEGQRVGRTRRAARSFAGDPMPAVMS
jgi:hypothetical protein